MKKIGLLFTYNLHIHFTVYMPNDIMLLTEILIQYNKLNTTRIQVNENFIQSPMLALNIIIILYYIIIIC